MFSHHENVLLSNHMCVSEKDECLEFKKAKGPELVISLGYEL